MNATPLKLATLAAALALVLGGCMKDSARDTYSDNTPPPKAESEPAAVPAARPAPVVKHAEPANPVPEVDGRFENAPKDELTGVQACDDFLSTYKACHTVIGAYDAVTLERRYAEMRSTLLRQSRDPVVAPELAARCAGLAQIRDEALAGRACAAAATDPLVDSAQKE